jgi:hypothetical protein
MNGVSIFAMKQFGDWLSALDQSLREKPVTTGQGANQIGRGTWMKSLSKSTARDFTFGVQSIMKVKCWKILSPNGATKLRPRNSS